MRKRWVTASVGFGLGAVLLLAGGLSAMATTSGFDVYKSAVKKTKESGSLTARVNVTVADNGTKVLTGSANVKMNRGQEAGSITAAIGSGAKTHTLDAYAQEGKLVVKSDADDVYRIMDHSGPAAAWSHRNDMSGPPKAVEQLFNALLGNIRDLAAVDSKPDGGKVVSLNLTGSQIPAVVNALGSIAVSNDFGGKKWGHAGKNESGNSPFPLADLKADLPKLTDNVKMTAVHLEANIGPDNVISGQTAEISLSGTDQAGVSHTLAVRLRVDFTGFNETTPDKIDLTGKQTETIQSSRESRGWRH